MGILEAYEKDGTLVITPDKVYDTKIKHADTNVTVNGTVKGLLRTCRNSVTVNGTVNERYR